MTVTWFPCYLQPVSILKIARWNVRPGLTAGLMSPQQRSFWQNSFSKMSVKETFEPNFLIEIDGREFTQGLLKRLGSQGHKRDELLDGIPKNYHDDVVLFPGDLFRWVLMSLSLCRTFEITTPFAHYSFRNGSTPGQLIVLGCTATHEAYDRSMYAKVPHHQGTAAPLYVVTLNKIATAIEPYYQPLVSRHDPVSVALSCFWAFLFARFPDQAYTSLVTILETLLSTGTTEISHQISERVAVLTGDTPKQRLETYYKTKELYNLRSRITHGEVKMKKGPITWGSTVISARMTIVSIPMLTDMAQCATAVLTRAIQSAEFMSTMHENSDGRKKALDDFFLSQLFS